METAPTVSSIIPLPLCLDEPWFLIQTAKDMPGRRQNYFLLILSVLRSLNVRVSRVEMPKIGTEVTLKVGAAVHMVGADLGPAHLAKGARS